MCGVEFGESLLRSVANDSQWCRTARSCADHEVKHPLTSSLGWITVLLSYVCSKFVDSSWLRVC